MGGAADAKKRPEVAAAAGGGDGEGSGGSSRGGAKEQQQQQQLPSYLERHGNRSHYFDGADPFALLKAFMPLQVAIGMGLLVSVLLPRTLSLTLALVLILPSAVRLILKSLNLQGDMGPDKVIKGRMAGKIEGDFCVVLIGASNGAPFKLTPEFKAVGDAFLGMIKELERLPGDCGFLGAEQYVTANVEHGSHTLAVQYWRSYDHLLRYAHGGGHKPAWEKFLKVTQSNPNIGLFHEAYIIEGGKYDALYVNCPPLGLGHAGSLVPATGVQATSRGRSGVADLKKK